MFKFLLALCFLVSATHLAEARRVALVIGNSDYKHTARLKNPRNDAQDVGDALKRLGFEVTEGLDLDKRSMERTIRQFGSSLFGADISFFFYAGHALQVSGQNQLLPVDARLSSEGDIDFEAIPLHLVLKQMEREAKTSLLLLDACRDNPLARNLARALTTRSGQIGNGLAEVRAGMGTLIGFSTQPTNVALDGLGRNSPYTAALLRRIETPGTDFSTVLIYVRNDVVTSTNGQQVPWEHTSLMRPVVLFNRDAVTPVNVPDADKEIAFWNAVKDSKSSIELQAYLNRFPNGAFGDLARQRLRLLEGAIAIQEPRLEEGSRTGPQKALPVREPKAPLAKVETPTKARPTGQEAATKLAPKKQPPEVKTDHRSFAKQLCDWTGQHPTMQCY